MIDSGTPTEVLRQGINPALWREQLLRKVLLMGLIFGGLTYIPSVYAALHFGFAGVAIVDSVAMAIIVYLALDEKLGFWWRAALFSLVMYVLGAWLMTSVGSISQIYLLAFSLLSTLLLGVRVGLLTVALNVATLLVVGYAHLAAPEMVTPRGSESFSSWVVVTLNFLLVNLMLTLALGMVIAALESALARSMAAQRALQSEQEQLLEVNRALRAQDALLRQAQKMDAVGRLAGGVAHDFNNMLNVILGHAHMNLADLALDDPRRADLEQIIEAAERSSGLTSQLLAFARQQTIAPQRIQLNDAIANMLKMLARLIGEDVELIYEPGVDLGIIKVDPSQIDQILANVAVNARDAISSVGKLVIETRNVTLDRDFVSAHPGSEAGPFVLLSISDDGVGMDKDTLSRLFEPFFTTKEVGRGTGLGLATVYGIVKQNRGFISVESEPGRGTTFSIYFPRITDVDPERALVSSSEMPPRGTETVLLVEDEVALLRLGKRLLGHLGYTVLTAGGPSAALRLAERSGHIDLLLTDVIMPEMTGRDVWQALSAERPGMKCLFVSGYTADVIAHRGVLEPGVHFLQKPFTIEQLAHKVRLVLDEN